MPPDSSGEDTRARRDLEVQLAAERAATEYWRDLAERRAADYSKLRRRPLVRALLGIDWRVRRLQPRAGSTARWRRVVGQLVLAAEAAVARLVRRRRWDAESLAPMLQQLSEPVLSHHRRVTLVQIGARNDGLPGLRGGALDVEIVPIAAGAETVAETRRALDRADTELVGIILGSTQPCDATALDRLAAAIEAEPGVVAAAPVLLHPQRPPARATPHDGLVRSAGLSIQLDAGVPVVKARQAGTIPAPEYPPRRVAAASSGCLLLDRAGYQRAGGLPLADGLDVALAELCVHLRARGGGVVVVPGSVMIDARPVHSTRELRTPIAPSSPAWRAAIERSGPTFARATRPPADCSTRFVFTVAAPSAKVAARWGDWHLADAMVAALRRRGHDVRLQTADHADDPAGRAADVHVVVRGLHAVRRTPGQRHVLWVINHPESIDGVELDAADLVLVASPLFAEHLRTRTTTPVEVLLQATDHRRFSPRPVDPAFQHPVTVVAKTRDVLRPVVADALRAGLRPAIYGEGWRQLVDPALVVADDVDNDRLPVVYSSAGVVLNDHWRTMQAWGFVSNRLYDVIACGTPVISDPVPGMDELFDGAVLEYRSADELRELVEQVLKDPARARERAARGRAAVLARHTFDHRADELLEMVAKRTKPHATHPDGALDA